MINKEDKEPLYCIHCGEKRRQLASTVNEHNTILICVNQKCNAFIDTNKLTTWK